AFLVRAERRRRHAHRCSPRGPAGSGRKEIRDPDGSKLKSTRSVREGVDPNLANSFATTTRFPLRRILMKRLALHSPLLAIALAPLWAFAQDGGLGAVAPFVNADTVAIVRVDLKKADIPAAVKSLTQSLPKELLQGTELKEAETKGEAVRKALVDNGVSEAFAVVGNFDLRMPHESFFIVLPVAQGKDPQAVIAAIEKIAGSPPPDPLPIVHNAILMG